MTELLKKAIDRMSQLQAGEQDAIATIVLAEIESEEQWTAAFAKSQDKLAKLAEAALDEAKQGKTKPFSEL